MTNNIEDPALLEQSLRLFLHPSATVRVLEHPTKTPSLSALEFSFGKTTLTIACDGDGYHSWLVTVEDGK